MKEMHLTPDLWIVSAKQIFLPKVKDWKNELSFWKQEAESLRRLITFGSLYCSQEEKKQLEMLEQELTAFGSEQIPLAESAIESLTPILEGKSLGCKFRKVEEKIEQLRTTYYALKMKLLPFFPKFVSARIW